MSKEIRQMTSFRLSQHAREGLVQLATEHKLSQAKLIENYVTATLESKKMELNAVRKVIAGKIYDIEKAEKVVKWDNGYSKKKDNYYSETLYRTKNGSWFLLNEGGKSSPMSRPAGNDKRDGGRDIEALDDEDLFEWLQKRNQVDLILDLFPDSIDEA